jgi:hypothetical protein
MQNPYNILKSIIPHVSRNFVLGTPQQFIYHLSKMGLFSKINAYNNLDGLLTNSDKYIDDFIRDNI